MCDSDAILGHMPRQVLLDDHEVIADRLVAHPGEWFLVGGDTADQFGVLRQTAYRIRHGLIRAYMPRAGGRFEAKVSSADPGGRERLHEIEVYARWAPTPAQRRNVSA